MNSAFEVAVPTEHTGCHQIVLADGERNLLRQRSGVSDARGTAVADEVEAEGLEIAHEISSLEVIRHDLGTGRQGGLHPWFSSESTFSCLASDQPRPDHHARVAGVRAGSDGRDDHVAVSHLKFGIVVMHRGLWPIRDRGDRTVGAFAAVAHPAIDL